MLIIPILLLGAGCTPSSTIPKNAVVIPPIEDVKDTVIRDIPSLEGEQKTAAINTEPESEYEIRLINQTWVSPAEVKIGNLYPGATAEWNLRIHNGNDASIEEEMYSMITDPEETVVDLNIKSPLANEDINKVVIISDNKKDNLVIISYNSNDRSLKISGFQPQAKRILTVKYKSWTGFFVEYLVSDEKRPGYALAPIEAKDWVIIEDSTPVLAPKETKEVLISISIPNDAVVKDNKWEFWTVAGERSGGTVQIQMATRWLVEMRN